MPQIIPIKDLKTPQRFLICVIGQKNQFILQKMDMEIW